MVLSALATLTAALAGLAPSGKVCSGEGIPYPQAALAATRGRGLGRVP